MQIKRFEAKDMKTALRLIKDELGPEAVILSARSLKKENKIFGMVKAVGVEVTAAIENPVTIGITKGVSDCSLYKNLSITESKTIRER